MPFWSAYRVVPVSVCSTSRRGTHVALVLSISLFSLSAQRKTVSLPTIGSLLRLVSLGSLGVGVVALVGLPNQVGPSILAILVCVFLLHSPGDTHAINTSHPRQDFHHNQARRNIPPDRIGYPSQPTRTNHYSKPIPPTHTFHIMRHGQAFGQMAGDRI